LSGANNIPNNPPVTIPAKTPNNIFPVSFIIFLNKCL
jgi:hypothetical protein